MTFWLTGFANEARGREELCTAVDIAHKEGWRGEDSRRKEGQNKRRQRERVREGEREGDRE